MDGSTPEHWATSPEEGVEGIAIRFGQDDSGRKRGEFISGSDWYWMHNGKIYQSGTSSDTPDVWLDHNAPSGAVLKKGKWTTNEHIEQVRQAMIDWVQ